MKFYNLLYLCDLRIFYNIDSCTDEVYLKALIVDGLNSKEMQCDFKQ